MARAEVNKFGAASAGVFKPLHDAGLLLLSCVILSDVVAPGQRQTPYQGGTKRSVAPEVTFERIQKYLAPYGITRLADATDLDCIGIPVYTSIRPRGRIIQSSQGKGARAIDAKVSALMESMEGYHAENPTADFVYASMAGLERAGRTPIDPPSLFGFYAETYWARSKKQPWVESTDLLSGDRFFVPASSVYFVRPSMFATSTNGLASGNDEQEATLHALLEIYERDALSLLMDGDEASFDVCEVIDETTIEHPILLGYLEQLRNVGVTLKLLRVSVESAIHTFIAFFLDQNPLAPSTHISSGFGSHLNPIIAASRAITESAQTRIGNIQSAREFLTMDMFTDFHESFYELAMNMEADTPWSALSDASSSTIAEDLVTTLNQCKAEGASHVLRHTLSAPDLDFAVVKLQIPGAKDDFPM